MGRDPEATRLAILDAAEAAFVDRGYAEVSISDVARLAGVTKSLIHHHFGSKERLWNEVKTRRFSEFAAAQQRLIADGGAGAELLRQSMITYFEFLRRNPQFVRFLAWMQLEAADAGSFRTAEELIAAGIVKIREAQAAGGLRSDVHPFSILVSFLGLAEHWFQGKDQHCRGLPQEEMAAADDDRYLEDVVKIFFEGVLPR